MSNCDKFENNHDFVSLFFLGKKNKQREKQNFMRTILKFNHYKKYQQERGVLQLNRKEKKTTSEDSDP